MASTRTPGITVNANGERTINKEHYGIRLFLRLGTVGQEYAEERLRTEMEQLDLERARKAHARPLFRDCAARYLAQSRHKRSIDVIKWHVQLLIAQIGDLEPHKVHDGTLEPFVTSRLASGTGPTTINRTLEVARTILIRAARSYRDDDGKPWLEGQPPMITMLPESPRSACPITWVEQDRLLRRLPDHLAVMTLFAVNTGLRDSNLCRLQWTWELPVPEIGRSVFVIPPEAFKSKRAHVVILNDAAWSIVQTQRGKHPIWVFPYKGNAVRTMNNTAWQKARRAIGLPIVRVHDLRHTYGARLRAAGVSHEDRAALLGHAYHSMPTLYASPDICRLVGLANQVLERIKTVTIVRVAYG
jgi:integrase